MSTPTADVSVRVAWADDAEAIAAVQVRAWRHEYAGLLPDEVLDSLDVGQFAEAWRGSMAAPKDARNRVLVALERNTVRGFAVTGPAKDPDRDPIAPEVIDALAGQWQQGGYDVKWLYRTILNTETYQRRSSSTESASS